MAHMDDYQKGLGLEAEDLSSLASVVARQIDERNGVLYGTYQSQFYSLTRVPSDNVDNARFLLIREGETLVGDKVVRADVELRLGSDLRIVRLRIRGLQVITQDQVIDVIREMIPKREISF